MIAHVRLRLALAGLVAASTLGGVVRGAGPQALLEARSAATQSSAAVDLSNPQAAMASLDRALRAGDEPALRQTVIMKPGGPFEAFLLANLQEERMRNAGANVFGTRDAVRAMFTIADAGELERQALPPDYHAAATTEPRNDGRVVALLSVVPAELLEAMDDEERHVLEKFVGSIFVFEQIGGQWRLDGDRSFKVEAVTDNGRGAQPGPAGTVRLCRALADARQAVTAALVAGRVTTPAAAQQMLGRETGQRLAGSALRADVQLQVTPFRPGPPAKAK